MTRTYLSWLALFVLVCVCLPHFLTAAAAQQASSTSIKVEVMPNGDAHWTTEKMIPLNTHSDVVGWDSTAADGTDKYRSDFESRMKDYVSKISSSIGRSMSVKDVNVSVEKSQPYSVSDNSSVTYGAIKYEFTWTGFALVRGDVLEVGDVFVDGFLLNKGDTISFMLPPGYTITSISPAYDEKKDTYEPQVIWTGRSINNTDPSIRLFSSGEPSITMHRQATTLLNFDWWVAIPIALLSAVMGFGAAFLVMRRREKPQQPPIEVPAVPDRLFVPEITAPSEPQAIEPYDSGRFLSDEEKIIMFLEEAGGQMFQSDLVKKTDFSKSKLSMVLSDLKEKGTIIKIKKGKENLIRLNKGLANAEIPPIEDEHNEKDL